MLYLVHDVRAGMLYEQVQDPPILQAQLLLRPELNELSGLRKAVPILDLGDRPTHAPDVVPGSLG